MSLHRPRRLPLSLRGTLAGVAVLATALAAAAPAQAAPITCGGSQPSFGTGSANTVVATSCSVNVPASSTVIVHATSGLAASVQGYEARFGIGVDGASEDAVTRRVVNVQGGGAVAREETVATTLRRTDLPAGNHTFSLLTALSSSPTNPVGNGPVNLVQPSISVIVIPAGSGLRTCGNARSDAVTTTSSDPVPVVSCTIDAPVSGKIFALASGWMAKQAGAGARPATEYEAAVQLRVGPGSENVISRSTRFINVYQDGAGGDGTDTTASTLGVLPVGAGSHTVDYEMQRFSDVAVGPGTVVQANPSVTVIFVPDNSAEAKFCDNKFDGSGFNSASTTTVNALSCSLPTMAGGSAFAIGSLSSGLSNGSSSTTADNWDGEFTLARGGAALAGSTRFQDAAYDRFSTSGSFPQDGTDRNIATSTLVSTSGAVEAFDLTARRRSGTGTIRLYNGTMAVLAFPPPPAGPAPDRTKPALGSLGLSRSVFRAAKSGAAFSAQRKKRGKSVPVGTKVSFNLSEPSSVRFTVQRKAKGRKSGGKCVKPKRSNRMRKACTRWESVRGSFTVSGKAGRNGFTFRGRVGGKKLKPGAYRLTGVATDPARNASLPKRKAFRIVR